MIDLIGGQVDMMLDVTPNTAPHVRAGKVKSLAVSTAKSVSCMPDVPTIAESGMPSFDVTAWDVIFAPAVKPQPVESSPEALAKFINAGLGVWQGAVKFSGAKVD